MGQKARGKTCYIKYTIYKRKYFEKQVYRTKKHSRSELL